MLDQPRLRQYVEPVVRHLGYELWGLESTIVGGQGFVRIFIDSPQGVTVDDCGLVSQRLSTLLDVHDPMPVPYRLEVSSPGLDRPLFEAWQYRRYVGRRVKLKLFEPRQGQRNLAGCLLAVDDVSLRLRTDEGDVSLRYEEIARGRLVFDHA